MTADPIGPLDSRVRRLQAANALLSDYASFLAHELRNPLTAAGGFLSLVSDGAIPAGPQAAEYLAQAQAAVRDAQAQLEALVDLAGEIGEVSATGHSPATDTGAAVQRVWAHLQAHTGTRAVLIAGTLPLVAVSQPVLERILYFLVGHAVWATGAVEKPRIVVTGSMERAGVALEVKDNGVSLRERGWGSASVFHFGTELENAGPADEDVRFFGRLVRCQGGSVYAQARSAGGVSVVLQLPAGSERNLFTFPEK